MRRQLRRLRRTRLTRPELCAIGAVSALATGLVIATALGHTGPQSQALALLGRQRIDHVVLPPRPVPAVPAAAPAPIPTPTPTPNVSAAAPPPKRAATPKAKPVTTTPARTKKTTTTKPVPSKVKHIFIITLTTPSYGTAFGRGSAMPYLDHVLRPEGDLLSGYETLGETNLPDYLAMVSGQGPNVDTEDDCSTYSYFSSAAVPDSAGEVAGPGCVYPDTVLTLSDQLDANRMTWKGYFEDLGSTLPAGQQDCQHPNSGAVDTTLAPAPGDDYATSQNPFVYFGSLLDLGDCASDDLPLTQLAAGLGSAADTANLVYIGPGLCDDGSETPCPGVTPTGAAGADAFLKTWAPMVLNSAAYRENGVLLIVLASARTQLPSGMAFGHPLRTGALVISPYARPGSTVRGRYTPYSVLRSVEDLLALTPLAHAKAATSFAKAALPRAWEHGG